VDEVDKEIPVYLIYEFVERPSSEYKNGRFIVYCSGKCL
jgi:hypothetical protein